ncbi:hypothetical protein IH781_04280, partial [Patescibacteria group bacterium]|nr:hypothetical protein [Patescibacteria group bacterium]
IVKAGEEEEAVEGGTTPEDVEPQLSRSETLPQQGANPADRAKETNQEADRDETADHSEKKVTDQAAVEESSVEKVAKKEEKNEASAKQTDTAAEESDEAVAKQSSDTTSKADDEETAATEKK